MGLTVFRTDVERKMQKLVAKLVLLSVISAVVT